MGFCIYAKQRNILKESSSMEPIVKHKNNIKFKNIQSHHNYFNRLSRYKPRSFDHFKELGFHC